MNKIIFFKKKSKQNAQLYGSSYKIIFNKFTTKQSNSINLKNQKSDLINLEEKVIDFIPFQESELVTNERILKNFEKNTEPTKNGFERMPPRGFARSIFCKDIKESLSPGCIPKVKEGSFIIVINLLINHIFKNLSKDPFMDSFKGKIKLMTIRENLINVFGYEQLIIMFNASNDTLKKPPVKWKYLSPRVKVDLFYKRLQNEYYVNHKENFISFLDWLTKKMLDIMKELTQNGKIILWKKKK